MAAIKTRTISLGSGFGVAIDQLPRGTALHAARTPLSKEPARVVSSKSTKLVHCNPTSSGPNNSSEDVAENSEPEASTTSDSLHKNPSGADLARRAARRVSVWKKSEQDRRGEEERARQVKLEQDKRRQNHAVNAKQRRRAEIYALNALLRQLQQEKAAQYIDAQKQIQEAQEQEGTGASLTDTAALAQIGAVGV